MAPEIYFFGLISHIGADALKQRAAIVRAPLHNPQVVINDVDGTGQQKVIPLPQNCVVSFGGAAPAMTDWTFQYVPSLTRVALGQIRPDVYNGQPMPSVAGYVNYPGGSLRVPLLYPKKGKYTLNGVDVYNDCVSFFVLLEPPAAPSVTVSVNGTPQGSTTSWVLVSNSSTLPGPGHAQAYANILQPPQTMANVTQTDACSAQVPPGVYTAAVQQYVLGTMEAKTPAELESRMSSSVECSDTGWP
jgi:hypothetical protein